MKTEENVPLSTILCNFSMRTLKYFQKILIFFCPQKVEKTTPKSCILMAVGRGFFLCSPACPKQPRTSFPFYKLFYPSISARISAQECLRSEKKTSFSPWLQQFTKDLLAANVSPWFGCKKLSRAKIFSSSFFIVMISPPVKVEF